MPKLENIKKPANQQSPENWDDIFKRLTGNQYGRQWLVKNYGFPAFCMIYLSHHFYKELGEVHYSMMNGVSDFDKAFQCFLSFRECGKTTITTLAFPLYLICEQIIPFCLLISATESLTKLMIGAIKDELEGNELLLADYGNVKTAYWGETGFTTTTGVRVTGKSRGAKLRGIKFRQFRPYLIIVDDPETLEDVSTQARRDKTYKWFFSEVLPCRDKEHGRIFFVGNLLHTDSLLSRLMKNEAWESVSIALTDDRTDEGQPMWKAKFPDTAAILEEKKKNDPIIWAREYMLKIVPEQGQIISEADIKTYNGIPEDATWIYSGIGGDLAISKKDTADFTALIRGDVYMEGEEVKIYLTKLVKERYTFRETLMNAKGLAQNPAGDFGFLFIEDVAYQKAAIQELEREMLPVIPMRPIGDKRARLNSVAPIIQRGQVLFPANGMHDLKIELVNFGIEAHDDTVDALVYLILGLQQIGLQEQTITWV